MTYLSLYDNINGRSLVFFLTALHCAAAKTKLQQRDTAGDYLTDPFSVLIRIEKVTLLVWIEQGVHWGIWPDSLNDHKALEWRLIQGWIMMLWKEKAQ